MEERMSFGWAVARLVLVAVRITGISVGSGIALAWASAFMQSFRM